MIEKSQKMKSKHQGDVKPKYIVSTCFFVLMGILMFVQLVILLLPIAWAIMASFKDPFDFSTSPFSFPDIFCWDNYTRAFKGLEVEYWSDSTQQLVSYNFFNMFCNLCTDFSCVVVVSYVLYVIFACKISFFRK